MGQCLAGLGAAHQAGLIHRDVKPGNVLLDAATGRALVADFGLVKTAGDGHGMTATGVVLGTVDYIAPEQARGRPVDGRADLYALGVLAFQMLSGRLPFRAETPSAMIFQHAYETPPPLREVAPNVPGPLAAVVDRLMAKDPAARHQSCEDVLEDLRRFRAGEPLAEAPDGTPGERPSRVIREPAFAAAPSCHSAWSRRRRWGGGRRCATGRWGGCTPRRPTFWSRLQNTGQQVDTALAEYQRRRDRLASLVEEATESAEELAAQAQRNRDAAAAARSAETGSDEEAARRAVREREECKRVAADLEAQAAEQREQVRGCGATLPRPTPRSRGCEASANCSGVGCAWPRRGCRWKAVQPGRVSEYGWRWRRSWGWCSLWPAAYSSFGPFDKPSLNRRDLLPASIRRFRKPSPEGVIRSEWRVRRRR